MTINEFFESARLIVPKSPALSVKVEMQRYSDGDISLAFRIYVGEMKAICIKEASPEAALTQLRKIYDCVNKALSSDFVIS